MSTEESLDRAEIRVSQDSWHYRLYQWWQNHSRGNPTWYRENLCHYVRVILIWVPLIWFFKEPIYKFVRPWMIAVPATLLATLTYYLVTSLEETITALLVIGAVCLLVGVFIGCLFGFVIFESEIKKAFKIATAPIWWPCYQVLRLLAGGCQVIGRLFHKHYGVEFGDWFFTARKWRVVYPWSVTLAVTIVMLDIIFGHTNVLMMVGIVVAAAAVVAAFIFAGFWIEEHPGVLSPLRTQKQKGSNFLRIIWQYLIAKKKKICPFIKLPYEWE